MPLENAVFPSNIVWRPTPPEYNGSLELGVGTYEAKIENWELRVRS